jgi:hypothetical protein
MNSEIAMIICMTSGVGLFALGGFRWKWMRRFLFPGILGLMAFLSGFPVLLCVGYAVAQAITLCLPYGERTPYALKAVVFASYALPSLLFGFTIWQIFLALGCFGLFVLSNWDKSAKSFPWKICEAGMGGLLGATIAALISIRS